MDGIINEIIGITIALILIGVILYKSFDKLKLAENKQKEKGGKRMRTELVCAGCGIMRIGEIDANTSEKECHATAKYACRVCGCPYVETRDEAKKD